VEGHDAPDDEMEAEEGEGGLLEMNSSDTLENGIETQTSGNGTNVDTATGSDGNHSGAPSAPRSRFVWIINHNIPT